MLQGGIINFLQWVLRTIHANNIYIFLAFVTILGLILLPCVKSLAILLK